MCYHNCFCLLFTTGDQLRNQKYYRYGLQFENMASHDVTFKWNEGGTERKQYVKGLSTGNYYGVLAVPNNQVVPGQMPGLDIK